MRSVNFKLIALLLLIVLLTGCGGAVETAGPTSPPSAPTPSVSPLSPPATPVAPSALPSPTASPLTALPTPPGKSLPPASERARTDLASRLGVDPAAIELVSVTAQEMPIQYLGCPPEDVTPRADMPAMVIGEEIVLRHDGVEHVYHAHLVRLFYCGER